MKKIPQINVETVFHEFEKRGLAVPKAVHQENGGGGGGHSGGGGHGGGGTTSGVGSPPDHFAAESHLWGFSVYVSHNNIAWIRASAWSGSAASAIVGALSTVPVVQLVAWAFAAYLVAEVTAIELVDKGNGVHVNMSWFAPGVFVPTLA